MNALPMHPTERDRERFRDITKAMQFGLEYDRRLASNGDYTDPQTVAMFRLWWSVERERQLLQNLNMSQGCKLSELAQKLEKAEDVLRSLASFVGAGGYNADKVDADVFEQKIRWGIGQIMERLEKAEAELARLRTAPNEIGLGKGEFVIWPVKINGVHGLAFVKTDDPKAVGTSHAEPEDGQIEIGAGDSAIYFGNAESAMVLAERLRYVISLMTGSDAAPVPAVAAPAVPDAKTAGIIKRLRDACPAGAGCKCMVNDAASELERLSALLQSAPQSEVRHD